MRTFFLLVSCFLCYPAFAKKQNEVSSVRISEFIRWYPAIQQLDMYHEWIERYEYGEWQYSGLIDAEDRTITTPQCNVNYGYSWFNISHKPVVITMPSYDKYFSLAIFDMNHFMEVRVRPEKPIVVKLPHQKSPIEDAEIVVINTFQGLAMSRHIIHENEEEVMRKIITQQKIEGGGGSIPFVVPYFTQEEQKEGLRLIEEYSYNIRNGRQLFGAEYGGVGDMDRSVGVYLGHLGLPSYVVRYSRDIIDDQGKRLEGKANYTITLPPDDQMHKEGGYWCYTIYNVEDRYLIGNESDIYTINSYNAVKEDDGTIIIHINPQGKNKNGIPTSNKDFYGILRVFEPYEKVNYPFLHKE